jgi:hypothetical protein
MLGPLPENLISASLLGRYSIRKRLTVNSLPYIDIDNYISWLRSVLLPFTIYEEQESQTALNFFYTFPSSGF